MEESKVVTIRLTLTRKQAKSIIEKAINWPFVEAFYCANSISNLLYEDYGQKNKAVLLNHQH